MDLSPWDFPRARVHHVLRLVLLFRSQLMVFFLHGLGHLFRQLLDLLRQLLQVLGRELRILRRFCHREIVYPPVMITSLLWYRWFKLWLCRAKSIGSTDLTANI